jgi:two-component system, chemotaxis family, chemotaxis protein CheY
MSKKIVLVGHCGPDNSYLRMAVTSALRAATVLAADDAQELDALLLTGVDLLLFNRELGWGFDENEGVDVIRSLRARHPNVKMMLVSNYAEAQAAAVAAGAMPGFGKREIGSSRVTQLLREALGDAVAVKGAVAAKPA